MYFNSLVLSIHTRTMKSTCPDYYSTVKPNQTKNLGVNCMHKMWWSPIVTCLSIVLIISFGCVLKVFYFLQGQGQEQGFFFGFCDVAQVVIIQKII
jgi:hypothetical protein